MWNGRNKLVASLIILLIIVCFAIYNLAFVNIYPTSLAVWDVEKTDSSISFVLVNMNSGLSINRWYDYQIVDNQLRITFYGTIIPFVSMPTDHVCIADEGMKMVECVVLTGHGCSRTVWQEA